jgi:hypothetical protein
MSSSMNPSSSQAGGAPASTPDAVLNDLRRQAGRKASLKMFYAAADVFRDYRGAFAKETATDRERLAAEYEQQGRAAEEARLGSRSSAAMTKPPAPVPSPAVSTLPPSPGPKAETSRPKRATADRTVRPVTPPVRLPSGQISFACRWCNEPISLDASLAGKLAPCPKCDLLVRVPKI